MTDSVRIRLEVDTDLGLGLDTGLGLEAGQKMGFIRNGRVSVFHTHPTAITLLRQGQG